MKVRTLTIALAVAAVIPLGAYMKLFGARPSLALSVKPVIG